MTPRWIAIFEVVLAGFLIAIGVAITVNYVAVKPQKKVAFAIPNLIEAQTLKINKKSDGLNCVEQSTAVFSGDWVQNNHQFCMTRLINQYIRYELPSDLKGTYMMTAYLTQSFDYGIIEFSLNGKVIGSPADLYSGGPVVSFRFAIGEVNFKGPPHILQVKVIGRNEGNLTENYHFGIDGFTFEKKSK